MLIGLAAIVAVAAPGRAQTDDDAAPGSSKSTSQESVSPNAEDAKSKDLDQSEDKPTKVGIKSISIVDAIYGRRQELNMCSALTAVTKLCQGKIRCTVQPDVSLCKKGQAISLLIPVLEISYRCAPTDPILIAHSEPPFSTIVSCNRKVEP